jgi:hypothetical protein
MMDWLGILVGVMCSASYIIGLVHGAAIQRHNDARKQP